MVIPLSPMVLLECENSKCNPVHVPLHCMYGSTTSRAIWWYLNFTYTNLVFGKGDWDSKFEIFSLVNSSSCKSWKFYFQSHLPWTFHREIQYQTKQFEKETKLCIFTLCKSPFKIEHLRMWNKNPSQTYLNYRQIFGITLSLCLCFK